MADDGGLSRFQQRMKAIPIAVREAVQPALVKSADEMADAMKTLAPVDSGDLKDSITVTGPGKMTPPYSQPGGEQLVPENSVAITVGNEEVRYPHLVEYGHKASGFSAHDVPPKPYFWPAFRLYRKRATTRIKRAISGAVKKNWGGS